MVLFITLCKVTALSHEFLGKAENLKFEEGLIEGGSTLVLFVFQS